MTCQQANSLVPDLPPSVQSVLCRLAQDTPQTTADLTAATGLARRTVYVALKRLRARGLLAEQVSLRDSRQTWFWLKAPSES